MTQSEVEVEIAEMNRKIADSNRRVREVAVIDAARALMMQLDTTKTRPGQPPCARRAERDSLRAALAKLDGGTP